MCSNFVYLALGSNVGDRIGHLCTAIKKLQKSIQITEISNVYKTVPWPDPDNGQHYYNMALQADPGSYTPLSLMKLTQSIEKDSGRQSKGDLQPRTLDIDIIFMNHECLQSEELTLPHPRWADRDFVCQPLSDLLITNLTENIQKKIHQNKSALPVIYRAQTMWKMAGIK